MSLGMYPRMYPRSGAPGSRSPYHSYGAHWPERSCGPAMRVAEENPWDSAEPILWWRSELIWRATPLALVLPGWSQCSAQSWWPNVASPADPARSPRWLASICSIVACCSIMLYVLSVTHQITSIPFFSKLLASFNNHEEACNINILCGKGRVQTQDLEYQSRVLWPLRYTPGNLLFWNIYIHHFFS